MPIEVHCNHCGKLVRAPDDAGGKHGKCPSCHQSVYIPTPETQIEPLTIAPIDTRAERDAARLRHESAALASRLMGERDGADAGAASAAPAAALSAPEVEALVVSYVSEMAKGNLSSAEALAVRIQRQRVADEVIARIMGDELPPAALAKLPRPVLNGFLKQLREKK